MARFTSREKRVAAEREVAQRQRVYSRLVNEGKMSPEKAALELEIMREIASDYLKLEESERLL
jgi:hypothetical protein